MISSAECLSQAAEYATLFTGAKREDAGRGVRVASRCLTSIDEQRCVSTKNFLQTRGPATPTTTTAQIGRAFRLTPPTPLEHSVVQGPSNRTEEVADGAPR